MMIKREWVLEDLREETHEKLLKPKRISSEYRRGISTFII